MKEPLLYRSLKDSLNVALQEVREVKESRLGRMTLSEFLAELRIEMTTAA